MANSHLSVPRGRSDLFEERCSTGDRCQFLVHDHCNEIGELQKSRRVRHRYARAIPALNSVGGNQSLWLIVLIDLGGRVGDTVSVVKRKTF
jgi:hypothetical protein